MDECQIVSLSDYRTAKAMQKAAKAIEKQLTEHGIIAIEDQSYVFWPPCDTGSYHIEINAPAPSLEAPDYSGGKPK